MLVTNTNEVRPPLDVLCEQIRLAVRDHRISVRRQAEHRFPGVQAAFDARFTGRAFIADVGLEVEVVRGETEAFYTVGIAEWRDVVLETQGEGRTEFFREIASALPPKSRILNIGAGGDLAPIVAFRSCDHEVVCTDAARTVTDRLEDLAGVPCFNADLVTLGSLLPQGAFDIVFGNSTLAYIGPSKILPALEQVSNAMTRGGVFTFDMTPLPDYLQAIEPSHRRAVVNDLDPDPRQLAALIRAHGAEQGLHAMAFRSLVRGQSLQLGLLLLLKDIFTGFGLNCRLGFKEVKLRGRLPVWTLWVDRQPGLFGRIPGEQDVDVDRAWRDITDMRDWHFTMKAIARPQAKEIGDLLGVSYRDERHAGWIVPMHVTRSADVAHLANDLRVAIAEEYSPHRSKESIRQWITEGPVVRQPEIPQAWILDQTLRKRAFDEIASGRADQDAEMARTDAMIDAAYRKG